MRVVGIDPGKTGALAHVDLDCMQVIDLIKMPVHDSVDGKLIADPRAVFELITTWSPTFVVLEHVGSRPHDGSAASWSFGHGFGLLLGALQIAFGDEHRVTLVRPSKWKGALGLSNRKRDSLAMARGLFPAVSDMLTRVTVDDGKAEALLLTEYHRKFVAPLASVEVF